MGLKFMLSHTYFLNLFLIAIIFKVLYWVCKGKSSLRPCWHFYVKQLTINNIICRKMTSLRCWLPPPTLVQITLRPAWSSTSSRRGTMVWTLSTWRRLGRRWSSLPALSLLLRTPPTFSSLPAGKQHFRF